VVIVGRQFHWTGWYVARAVGWRKKAAIPHSWRVQAFWTVGDERRNYRPVFCDDRDEAQQVAAEMKGTLSHFPTLDVVIAPATAEEVEAERLYQETLADRPPKPLHLMLDPARQVTACGLAAEGAGGWSTLRLWSLSIAQKCPTCNEIAESTR
jgi:hypothetical protein